MPGARLLFSLDPAVAHLNHGGFGAVPASVQRAQQGLREEMESNPVRFFAQGLVERIAEARTHLAGFVGADPEGTALVGNATTAVSIVLNSLDLRRGEEILLTDHGYGSVTLAVERACGLAGARSSSVRLPLAARDDEVVEALAAAVVPGRTRLVIVDQVTSPTAKLLPVARIAQRLRGTGAALLVDAAHAPGMLPLRVDEIGADFWLGNLHKWAYAPRGTALLVVAPPWRERIASPVVSWQQPAGFPAAVEFQGTADYTPWLAAPAGLHTLRSIGVDAVRAHNAALAAYGQMVVGRALGLEASALPDPGGPVSLRVVPLPAGLAPTREEAQALRDRIAAELATEVAVSHWPGHALLRLSAQIYNRAEEYDRLAEHLPGLLRPR
jgi:isopenicillin-N epimerase